MDQVCVGAAPSASEWQGVTRQKANLCRRREYEAGKYEMEKIADVQPQVCLKILDEFKNADVGMYYRVKCEDASGLEGWIRQSCVDRTAVEPHRNPDADCAQLPPSCWISRNGGKYPGGEQTVHIYSSPNKDGGSVDRVRNDDKVSILHCSS